MTGTIEDFCRVSSCTQREVESSIIEIENKKIGEVQRQSNGVLTLINRRLKNEEKERELNRLRFKRWNEKQRSNASSNGSQPPKKIEDRRKKIEERIKASVNNKSESDNDGLLSPKQKPRIKDALINVLKKYPRFNHQKILADAVRTKKHPEAIIYALEEVSKDCKGFSPEKYFEVILQRTSGNYYEAEAIKNHEAIKKSGPQSIGECLKGAINGMPSEMQTMPEDEQP